MIKESVARSGQEPQTRIDRGRRLYAEHAGEIRFDAGVWFVPSEHEATSVYEVTLGGFFCGYLSDEVWHRRTDDG